MYHVQIQNKQKRKANSNEINYEMRVYRCTPIIIAYVYMFVLTDWSNPITLLFFYPPPHVYIHKAQGGNSMSDGLKKNKVFSCVSNIICS